ncbi:MAG TPA: two-component regulator propeller domain-containing protein [Candidatus Krumholzibacteria bacterium]|nr:two-component regulator propeller domain-containing protein [Candidatus Krumholzibacteria bacterium]
MISRLYTFIFLALLLAAPVAAGAQELPFTQYSPLSETHPLPSAEVNAVYQDREGLVWFVIFSSGLVRYDGHSTELYTTADGLADQNVWDVVEDPAGRLWVGSNAGLVVSEKPLGKYAPGERIHFSGTFSGHTLPGGTAIYPNRMAVDPSGRLWVGTVGGIVRIQPDGGIDSLSTEVKGAANHDVRSLVARRDGSVWVAIGGGLILSFAKDSTTPVRVTTGDNTLTETNALYETPDGVLYGGCRDGLLWRAEERGGHPAIVPVNHDLASNIGGIMSTPDDELWVASEGTGVMRVNLAAPDHRVIIARANGLLSDTVHRILRDAEGNLWFAQSGGASRLRANYRAFTNYPTAAQGGILPAPITAVVPPARHFDTNAIWLGTSESGVVALRDDQRVESIGTAQGLRHDWVNSLVFDDHGRLWVGSVGGINCIAPDHSMLQPGAPRRGPAVSEARLFDRRVTITSYVHRAMYMCQRVEIPSGAQGGTVESIWFSGFRGLICLVDNTWYMLRDACGLPNTAFQGVDFDADGRLWVATRDHGIYRSTEPVTAALLKSAATVVVPYPPDQGTGTFGMEVSTPLFEPAWSDAAEIDALIWNDGTLWVGSPDGVFAIDGSTLKTAVRFDATNGLGADNGTSMAFAPDGSLWVGTNGGLSLIDPHARTVQHTVTRQDGLVDNEVWYLSSARCGVDGTVYFGTAKGLALYHPDLDATNPLPPRMCFRRTAFTEDNNGNNELSLEYAALSFADEKRVRYRTRLAGYDHDWSAATSDFKTRYTNLGAFMVPRTYTFEVMACNNAGVWTKEPLTHQFSVTPAWWLRWWSMLSQFVMLVGIVIGAGVYRTRALEKRNRQLEQTVQERTAEVRAQAQTLQEQNVELDQKNQEIVRTQQQLIVQEKLASLGQLTAGIAHEIRNPLNFVNNFAQLSNGLIDELREDITANKEKLGDKSVDYIESIIQDLEGNLKRINEHGKRADGIVQGMLMHSRGQKGERAPTKLNALIDEQAQLTYLSVRNAKPDLSVVFKKEYDNSIGEIPAIPQDLSRVFINIINNALYAAEKRKASMPDDWQPLITMSTKDMGETVEVRIRDNGTGMPADVREKVFQPFFTTKPTGQGTGLGLSISYDIIVAEHKGTIRVESQENDFTEFIIELPKK